MNRPHLAVTSGVHEWHLQWAMPITNGHVYGPPVETFKTRAAAVARKREIDRGMAKIHPFALLELAQVLPGNWRFVSHGVEMVRGATKFCAWMDDGMAWLAVDANRTGGQEGVGETKSFRFTSFDECYRAFKLWVGDPAVPKPVDGLAVSGASLTWPEIPANLDPMAAWAEREQTHPTDPQWLQEHMAQLERDQGARLAAKFNREALEEDGR